MHIIYFMVHPNLLTNSPRPSRSLSRFPSPGHCPRPHRSLQTSLTEEPPQTTPRGASLLAHPRRSPDQPDCTASTNHTTRGLAPGPCSHPSVFQLSELTPLQEAVSALCWEGSKAFLSLESEWLEQNPGLPFSRHLKIGKLITFFRHHIAKQEYLIQRYYENLMKSHT